MGFIQRCLAGDAEIADIDNEVATWHAGTAGQGKTLHEHLGMSWKEYKQWATRPSALQAILSARRRGVSLAEELAKLEE